jgi:hypothetical protein
VSDLDPLDDLLPSHHPVEFNALPQAERRWRLRLFLATWARGAPDDLSWATALNSDPIHVMESVAILADISDEAIRAAVVERQQIETAAWWDGLLAESRASRDESRVTVLSRDRRPSSTPGDRPPQH